MKRPALEEIPLSSARFGEVSPSMNTIIGWEEWDSEIQVKYDHGFTIIEFDGEEKPARAFRKTIINLQPGLFTKEGSDCGNTRV